MVDAAPRDFYPDLIKGFYVYWFKKNLNSPFTFLMVHSMSVFITSLKLQNQNDLVIFLKNACKSFVGVRANFYICII